MTIHSQSRRHLDWENPKTTRVLLNSLTEFSHDELDELDRKTDTEVNFIDRVLKESDRNFIRSVDAERKKTIVVYEINGTHLQ